MVSVVGPGRPGNMIPSEAESVPESSARVKKNEVQSRLRSSFQQLIQMAKIALELHRLDVQGNTIPKGEARIWSWELPVYGDPSKLKGAISEVFGENLIADDDLHVLRQGISWAVCVGNREFLYMWNNLVTELRKSRDDRGRDFWYYLVRFIYVKLPASCLSPLHFAFLRPSEAFLDMVLDLLSHVVDEEEYIKYIFLGILDRPPLEYSEEYPDANQRTVHSDERSVQFEESSEQSDERSEQPEQFLLLVQRSFLKVCQVLASFLISRSAHEDVCIGGSSNSSLNMMYFFCLGGQIGGIRSMRKKIREVIMGSSIKVSTSIKSYLLASTSDHKLTPLHLATIVGSKEVVAELLMYHKHFEVNIHSLDCGKRTALHWALYEKREDIVRLLVSHILDTKEPSNATVEDGDNTTPMKTAQQWDFQGNTEISDLLLRVPDVERQIEKLYRDRQVYVDAANAKLVGAALIASVTFGAWLQPPLGYVQDEHDQSFAALGEEFRVRVFWVFNCLSFFFAMATVLTGAGSVLPRNDIFIKEAVPILNRWLMATSVLLTITVMCGLGAFIAAGFAVLPPVLSLEWYMIVPTGIGIIVCFAVMLLYTLGIYKDLQAGFRKRRKAKGSSSGCDRRAILCECVIRNAARVGKRLQMSVTKEIFEYNLTVAHEYHKMMKDSENVQTLPMLGKLYGEMEARILSVIYIERKRPKSPILDDDTISKIEIDSRVTLEGDIEKCMEARRLLEWYTMGIQFEILMEKHFGNEYLKNDNRRLLYNYRSGKIILVLTVTYSSIDRMEKKFL